MNNKAINLLQMLIVKNEILKRKKRSIKFNFITDRKSVNHTGGENV